MRNWNFIVGFEQYFNPDQRVFVTDMTTFGKEPQIYYSHLNTSESMSNYVTLELRSKKNVCLVSFELHLNWPISKETMHIFGLGHCSFSFCLGPFTTHFVIDHYRNRSLLLASLEMFSRIRVLTNCTLSRYLRHLVKYFSVGKLNFQLPCQFPQSARSDKRRKWFS